MDLNATLVPRTGFYAVPYGDGLTDQAPLAVLSHKGILNPVRRIMWIPKAASDEVVSRTGKYDATLNTRVILLPASPKTLQVYGYPAWMDTVEKREWWHAYSETAQRLYFAIVNNHREDEAIKMFDAQANAAFWDRAYRIREAITAPGRALLAGMSFAPLLLGVAVLAVVLRYKSPKA